MIPDPAVTLDACRDALARLSAGGNAGQADMRILAQALLDIAELAMPDSIFAADARCQLARAILAGTPA
jgi:hypothetical protein